LILLVFLKSKVKLAHVTASQCFKRFDQRSGFRYFPNFGMALPEFQLTKIGEAAECFPADRHFLLSSRAVHNLSLGEIAVIAIASALAVVLLALIIAGVYIYKAGQVDK